MSDPITVTLTKEQAAELERFRDVIIDRMNRVDFLAHVADQQAEHLGGFSSSAWDGLSATMKDLNRAAATEHSFISSLVDKLSKEAAA